jgi:hypothetical protein
MARARAPRIGTAKSLSRMFRPKHRLTDQPANRDSRSPCVTSPTVAAVGVVVTIAGGIRGTRSIVACTHEAEHAVGAVVAVASGVRRAGTIAARADGAFAGSAIVAIDGGIYRAGPIVAPANGAELTAASFVVAIAG